MEIFIAWLPKDHLHLVLPERVVTAFISLWSFLWHCTYRVRG